MRHCREGKNKLFAREGQVGVVAAKHTGTVTALARRLAYKSAAINKT
jgi:hypothetical protein